MGPVTAVALLMVGVMIGVVIGRFATDGRLTEVRRRVRLLLGAGR